MTTNHPRANAPTAGLGSLSLRTLSLLSFIIVILDQVTKYLVRTRIPLHENISIFPYFLDFTHVHNTGAAFGFLNSVEIPYKPALMTVIGLVALVAIGIFAITTTSQQPLSRFGLAFIFGGATGNLIDRVTIGYVIDFIDVYWGTWHFWAFNIADSAITVGACFLILETFIMNRYVSTSN